MSQHNALTKNVLMKYTLIALAILTAVSALAWGLTPVLLAAISVSIAVALDYGFSLVLKDKGPINTWSAAVYGLIVSLSYSLANTNSFTFGPYLTSRYIPELLPLTAPMAYVYVGVISAVGMAVFKKLQGMLKRKYVNPAAAAKLLVFLPFAQTVLLAQAHNDSVPLNGPIGYSYTPGSSPIYSAFGALVQACFGDVKVKSATVSVSPTEL